jgi:protein-S-isoprenylcysteine O-methyltransferase Ste14
MAMMGDVRARGEETVLLAAFGEDYRRYATKVRRFIPGIY